VTILALDPSSTCAGWAILRDDGQPPIAGVIAFPDGMDIIERLDQIALDVRDLLPESRCPEIDAVVFERPEDSKRGKARQNFKARGHADMAHFGMAAGALYSEVKARLPGRRIYTPTPSQWVGRGRVPSSKGDPHKERRVRWVEHLYRMPEGALGPKTKAGNVADAVLMARWGLNVASQDRLTSAKGAVKA